MSPFLDQILVLLTIALALSYLVWRRVRYRRRASRDWTSGHAEACTSCPVIKINEARKQKTLTK